MSLSIPTAHATWHQLSEASYIQTWKECSPATSTDFEADTIPSLLWSKAENSKGTGKRPDSHVLLMGNCHTCLTKLHTVRFQCHGNLQKELYNDKTSWGGLYQLKNCYNKTRIPKIGSLNTRSSTSAIARSLHPKTVSKPSPLPSPQTAIQHSFHHVRQNFLPQLCWQSALSTPENYKENALVLIQQNRSGINFLLR